MSLEIILHLAPAIELVGSSEVTAFHPLENGAGVDHAAFVEIKVDSGTQELFCQQWNVEMVAVVTCKVAACEVGSKLGSKFLETRGIFYVFIGDTRQFHNNLRNLHTGIDEQVLANFRSVEVNLNIRYLDDPVLYKIKPRCLQVEDNEGLSKIQFHLSKN